MASETLISHTSPGRDWGDRLVHGLIASHIQSILAYYLIKFFKKKKKKINIDISTLCALLKVND
jgi:hypothetical protein